MEIDRLNKEIERKDKIAIINAAEMAAQKAQLAAQNEKIEAMHAILVANGLLSVTAQSQPLTNGGNSHYTQSRPQ